MKINPRPQCSFCTAAAGYPKHYACIQHNLDHYHLTQNFKEVGSLFQGFLIFASGNFIIRETRKELNVLYSLLDWSVILERPSPIVLLNLQVQKGAEWVAAMLHLQGTCPGFSPPHSFSWSSQDAAEQSAKSLCSPVWTWKTAAAHRFFLLGKLSGRCQACFCSPHCNVRAPKVKPRGWEQAKEKALLQFTYAPISTALLSVFSRFFHCPSHYLVNLLLPSAFTIAPRVFST